MIASSVAIGFMGQSSTVIALLVLGLVILVLFINAIAICHLQRRRGCNALLVLLAEITILCLPAAVMRNDPLLLLPSAFVLFLYLFFWLPLTCFKEKMLAVHSTSSERRPPSPRILCIFDGLLTFIVWLFLVATIVSYIAFTVYLIESFKQYAGSTALALISQLAIVALTFGSLVYLVTMVLRNLKPHSRIEREGRTQQSEHTNAEAEVHKEGLSVELSGQDVATNEGDGESHAVNIV